MYRLVLLCCIAMVLFVPRAQAIEMFTNFHNGENIGFPPMEVPTAIYGHGGWHGSANCRPQRVQSIESVPAMTPTGFVRRDHGRKGYEAQHVGNQQAANQQVGNQQVDNQTQYVSDRRRSWGGANNSSTAGYSQQSADYEASETSATQAPTPAKVAPKSDGWTRSLEQAPAEDEHAKRPTSVFAHPGSAPQAESVGKIKSNAGQGNDQRSPPSSGASSRRTNDNLRSVTPAQPID